MSDTIYKIKDSVDLFLNDNQFLTVYFMNTRQRQSFRINTEMIHLIELIDGVSPLNEIYQAMANQFNVDRDSVDCAIAMLLKKKIITEICDHTDYISDEDYARYSRQINYFAEFLGSEAEGIAAQIKLMNSHIGVFGCGAVGGNIALQLVMAGVKEITLFDMDDVEQSDVGRHMFYSCSSVGENKVIALKNQLLEIDHEVKVNCICSAMKPTDNIEPVIEHLDFIINTLDEPYIGYTSSKISRICVKHNIPHFIAGGFDAHLASTGEIIIPYVTPCVECYASHFKVALAGWKPQKHPVKSRYTEIGGLAAMSLFSSSYACIEIIKYIAGLTDMESSYKVRGELLFNDLKITYLDIKKNPVCPICGRKNVL